VATAAPTIVAIAIVLDIVLIPYAKWRRIASSTASGFSCPTA
jgi:hypothetical protein